MGFKRYDSSMQFEVSMTRTPYTIEHKYTRYKRDPSGKILKDKSGKKLTETVTESIHSQSDEVFFIVNIHELFGVDLNYPGLKSCVNKAYLACKATLPVKTGYSKSYFKMQQLDNRRVKLYYDKAMVGGLRNGTEVKDYYVIYFFEMAKHFSFLDKGIAAFYNTLYSEVKKLFSLVEITYSNNDFSVKPSYSRFEEFYSAFNKQYYAKLEAERQRRLTEDEKNRKLLEKIRELKSRIKLTNDDNSRKLLLKLESEV